MAGLPTGTMVSFDDPLVTMTGLVREDPGGSVVVIVCPSPSVRVCVTEAVLAREVVGVEDGSGAMTIVDLCETIVVRPVIDDPGGRVVIIVCPCPSVKVCVTDAVGACAEDGEDDGVVCDEGDDEGEGLGPTTIVELCNTMVVLPVIDEPGGSVTVIGLPLASVTV